MATKIKKEETEPRKKRLPPVTIQNAVLLYKNFAGAAKRFNAKGMRNFHVILEPSVAKAMEQDGWNVKWHAPKEDGEEEWVSIKVNLSFDKYPPRVVMITAEGNQTILDGDSIDILDFAELSNVDLTFQASAWENAKGEKGYKTWLRKIFVTLSPTDLEAKYASGRRIKHDEEND